MSHPSQIPPFYDSEEQMTFSSQESITLITDMINKAKAGVNENGISAIMWGTVVAIAGVWSWAGRAYQFNPLFDPWLLCLFALIPQAYLVWKEKRERPFKRHNDDVINAVWAVYGISIGLMVFYQNVTPFTSAQIMAENGQRLQLVTASGAIEKFYYYPPSSVSLMLILYFIPTMVMGMGARVRPMLIGALLNVGFFFLSLWTPTKIDLLLAAATGICNWLIPGVLMRMQYLKAKRLSHV